MDPISVRPVIIGLTGGIASGKSTVALMFSDLGAMVIDADRLGHEVLNEQTVKKQIRAQWGDWVFENGDVNRRALADVVFSSTDNNDDLARLESITHPRIKERMIDEIRRASKARALAVVVDAPLLFEAGWDELCDKIVFVKTLQSLRLKRAIHRGWTKEEFFERERRQASVEDKQNRSTHVVDNSEGQESTTKQIIDLWNDWGLELPDREDTPHVR